MGERKLPEVKTLVVKVGTYTLSDQRGRLDREQVRSLVDQIAMVRARVPRVVLVSSGAIAAGVELMGLSERPRDIPTLQAASSVGQGLLVRTYADLFAAHGILVGQVLFTQYDFAHRRQYLNARNTFRKLLEHGVLPLVNENDTVAVEEIRFGDNDRLAALVAVLTGANLLVMLSDVEGLYSGDPRRDREARLIHEVKEVTPELTRVAGRAGGEHSSGGMRAKLEAARIANAAGIGVVVAPGREPRVLERVLEGERLGTYFHPSPRRLRSQKHWIAYGATPRGTIVVDDGAREALLSGGKSLLPAGVLECRGDFGAGDAVEVVDARGRTIARGICGMSSLEVNRVKGLHTREAAWRLGGECEEVIHRDYLVLLDRDDTGN
ncbi:glutamate 5-kinase [Candidatus Solincola tengchongensis]|uniref:glutamate 5-kinase n=1 Tax=Candidatus Solincola tengchongensis TaxID=2900693 RepID=UPI00257D3C46|nr:glutamate 5-kinase [Candidatus Solincola tengchongensis]